jgi:hypothetical protein
MRGSEFLSLGGRVKAVIPSLVAAVLLTGSYTIACPQLAGRYSCKFGGDPTELKVEQRAENKIQIYKVIFNGLEQEFITDGKSRTAERDGEKITYSAECSADRVLANLRTDSDGSVMNTKITVKQVPSLDVVLTYEIIDPASSEPSMAEEIECKKLR